MADVFVENILYLGDTRSADDLSVFTKMAPERLCLECGLRVDELFAPIATGERKKLFYAAQKLLTFVLHEVSAQTVKTTLERCGPFSFFTRRLEPKTKSSNAFKWSLRPKRK